MIKNTRYVSFVVGYFGSVIVNTSFLTIAGGYIFTNSLGYKR